VTGSVRRSLAGATAGSLSGLRGTVLP